MQSFEEIPHTADWSFRAFGRDLRALFENAAIALFTMEGAIPPKDPTAEATIRQVHASGIDRESLLVDWLSELVYLQDLEHETYYRFQVLAQTPTTLDARVWGTPFTGVDKLVKAVTFHNLSIRQTSEGWEATVVLDV